MVSPENSVADARQKVKFEELHINQVLGRHDFHPYEPNMPDSHPCHEKNSAFFDCASREELSEIPLHLKHVKCYQPYKMDLMKCLTKYKSMNEKAKSEGII